MCFIVCHQNGIFGLGSKEEGLYLHVIAYEGGTGLGETGWGKLEAAKKVTWAQLSKTLDSAIHHYPVNEY